MAQDGGFKHITVSAAEDDDVVIQAGLAQEQVDVDVAADGPSGKPTAGRAGDLDHGRVETLAAEVPVAEAPDKEIESSVRAEEPIDAEPPRDDGGRGRSEVPAKAKPRDRNAYRDQTLEDLEPSPMSLTQKVVIIAAVVCIIGAIVYYFAFMG